MVHHAVRSKQNYHPYSTGQSREATGVNCCGQGLNYIVKQIEKNSTEIEHYASRGRYDGMGFIGEHYYSGLKPNSRKHNLEAFPLLDKILAK